LLARGGTVDVISPDLLASCFNGGKLFPARAEAVDTGRGDGLTDRAELYGDGVVTAILGGFPYDKHDSIH